MLICLPTNGNACLQDSLSDHFGSANYFTIYDTDTDQLTVIENDNAYHSHGTCHPIDQLSEHQIAAIVCSGIGRRAIEAFMSAGIKVYQSNARSVAEVVELIKNDRLREIDPNQACQGHGHQANFPGGGRDARSGSGGCRRQN